MKTTKKHFCHHHKVENSIKLINTRLSCPCAYINCRSTMRCFSFETIPFACRCLCSLNASLTIYQSKTYGRPTLCLLLCTLICHKSGFASIFPPKYTRRSKIDVNAKIIIFPVIYLLGSESGRNPAVFFEGTAAVVVRLRLSLDVQLVAQNGPWRKVVMECLVARQRQLSGMMI